MPRKSRQQVGAPNATIYVARLYDFHLKDGAIYWLSDENHGTEVRCMSVNEFRRTFGRMADFLATIGPEERNVIPFPGRED